MRITPSLEEVKVIASTHQYDVVPLSCEMLSDFTTPTAICLSPRRQSTAGDGTRSSAFSQS